MFRGLVTGGLVALAIAATPVYDDHHMHANARALGLDGPWIPDPVWTLGPVAIAIVAGALIARVLARGGRAWPLVIGASVLAAIVIGWQTSEVAQHPGDATPLRMFVLPAILAVSLVGALVLARRPSSG